jgi:hypothetical protein
VTVAAPASRVLDVGLHGLVVRLTCSDPETVGALEERFDAFTPAAATDADVTVTFATGRPLHMEPRDGRRVYESALAAGVYSPGEDALYGFHAGGASMRCEPLTGEVEIVADAGAPAATWLLTRPLLTLALMEALRARGLHPLHAAALAGDRGGVLVCGPSGAGKSTLALALLDAGLDFLGDDLAFLETSDNLSILGFPDEIGLVEREPRPGWPKGRVSVHELVPAERLRARCRPHLLVLLSESPGASPEPIDSDTALLELLPSILLTDPARVDAHLDALAKLAGSATLWRVPHRPDLHDLVEQIVTEVARPRPNDDA